MKTAYVFLLAFTLVFTLSAADDSMLRVTATGKSPPRITSKTKARVMALRAAKVEGYKKLITAAGFAREYQKDSKTFTLAAGHLTDVRIVKQTYIDDHTAVVVMEVPANRLVNRLTAAKKRFSRSRIDQVKNKIRSIQNQMSQLNRQLNALKDQLRELEEWDQ